MIVNYQKNGWEVITQRAHGLLAAQLAANWRTKDRPARWIEFLVAVADHDDAQTELQRDDLLTPQGGPLDYKMRAFDLDHARRTLEFAGSKSRYIALLCSLHLHFIAGERSGQNEAVRHYLDVQKKQRTIWRRHLQMSEEVSERDYRLLEWCDALSLLICQHDDQPALRAVEISEG
ncbi:MAG: DUF3891 family protein, partial [Mucilaginibacter sp.]|nr:DUF3891 family protein [Mucilaginibacter sp.]